MLAHRWSSAAFAQFSSNLPLYYPCPSLRTSKAAPTSTWAIHNHLWMLFDEPSCSVMAYHGMIAFRVVWQSGIHQSNFGVIWRWWILVWYHCYQAKVQSEEKRMIIPEKWWNFLTAFRYSISPHRIAVPFDGWHISMQSLNPIHKTLSIFKVLGQYPACGYIFWSYPFDEVTKVLRVLPCAEGAVDFPFLYFVNHHQEQFWTQLRNDWQSISNEK